jgi:hypothetical protein
MMCDTAQQVHELLWNITIEAADVVYTDALEYYASVREAACQKARGFLARSLRFVPSVRAQTPHIYSWSFVRPLAKRSYKTPKLSGYAG